MDFVELRGYSGCVQRKVFWISFLCLDTVAGVYLPLWWTVIATIPIVFASWWVAYRSGWFE